MTSQDRGLIGAGAGFCITPGYGRNILTYYSLAYTKQRHTMEFLFFLYCTSNKLQVSYPEVLRYPYAKAWRWS